MSPCAVVIYQGAGKGKRSTVHVGTLRLYWCAQLLHQILTPGGMEVV